MDLSVKEKFNRAFELHTKGDLQEAEGLYNEILSDNPNNSEVLNLLGLVKFVQNDLEDAEKYIQKALFLKPDAYFFENLAKVYLARKNYSQTVVLLEEACNSVACGFEIYFLLGVAYKNIAEYENAEKAYLKAIEFNPSSEKAYYNLASLYLFLNSPQKSVKYFKKCLEINPEDKEVRYFLSLGYFRMKNYDLGMKYFEDRLCRQTAIKCQEVTYPKLFASRPIWRGENISDKVIYTYYEAGFGDMIMFARYIPELQKRCKKIILKTQANLVSLFKENFPYIEVMDLFKDESEIDFDVHIPFLSIPFVLGLGNEQMFIHREGYLKAEPEKVQYYLQNYFDNSKFKIAIKWQGNTYYETDRVINVDAFTPLFDFSNVQVYSAQTFEGSEELSKLSVNHNIIDLASSFKDFSFTAGALTNVDLVICSDTSLAHLAGAMGKPCIVLLPYNYNWRWHMDLSHCDWYDSVKLFTLERNESWNELMIRVCNYLSKSYKLKSFHNNF